MSDKELELLRMQIKLLETQLELERVRGGNTGSELSRQIREQLDQPDPIVVRNIPSSGTITKEMLEDLTPAELFILAHNKGVDIKHIFPI